MDKTLFVDGSVDKKGKVELDIKWLTREIAARWLGKKFIVRVQTWSSKRSLAANNYYWGVIVECIAEYTGYTKDEVHALLKEMFAQEPMFVVNEKTGEIIETLVPRQTRSMTKAEFAAYIEKCTDFAVSLGIQLPYYEGDRYAYREDD